MQELVQDSLKHENELEEGVIYEYDLGDRNRSLRGSGDDDDVDLDLSRAEEATKRLERSSRFKFEELDRNNIPIGYSRSRGSENRSLPPPPRTSRGRHEGEYLSRDELQAKIRKKNIALALLQDRVERAEEEASLAEEKKKFEQDIRIESLQRDKEQHQREQEQHKKIEDRLRALALKEEHEEEFKILHQKERRDIE